MYLRLPFPGGDDTLKERFRKLFLYLLRIYMEWECTAKRILGKRADTGYEAANNQAHVGYVRGQSSL
jgi:hypothetical protein